MRASQLAKKAALVALTVLPFSAGAGFYPNYGYMCYDGQTYGYAYKYWTSQPGPWTGDGPG
jgi:hypothetical protein